MDERKFPDITFVDSDTESIANEMIEDYQSRTGRTLYPADPVRVLLLYVASVISQERAITNNAAKQNVPRFAKNSYLDSLCEIFRGVERLSAVPARTSIVFEISEPQDAPVVIPAGTRVTADGSVMFATISEGVIPVGEIAVETTAHFPELSAMAICPSRSAFVLMCSRTTNQWKIQRKAVGALIRRPMLNYMNE